jgi:hypothetical protein
VTSTTTGDGDHMSATNDRDSRGELADDAETDYRDPETGNDPAPLKTKLGNACDHGQRRLPGINTLRDSHQLSSQGTVQTGVGTATHNQCAHRMHSPRPCGHHATHVAVAWNMREVRKRPRPTKVDGTLGTGADGGRYRLDEHLSGTRHALFESL